MVPNFSELRKSTNAYDVAVITHADSSLTVSINGNHVMSGSAATVILAILLVSPAKQVGIETIGGKEFGQPEIRGKTRRLIDSIFATQLGRDRWKLEFGSLETFIGSAADIVGRLLIHGRK